MNGANKSHANTLTLEGNATSKNAVDSFKKAVRAEGGFVVSTTPDSASASFGEIRAELQMTAEPAETKGVTRVILHSLSTTTVARVLEFTDVVGELPGKVAAQMTGFTAPEQTKVN